MRPGRRVAQRPLATHGQLGPAFAQKDRHVGGHVGQRVQIGLHRPAHRRIEGDVTRLPSFPSRTWTVPDRLCSWMSRCVSDDFAHPQAGLEHQLDQGDIACG